MRALLALVALTACGRAETAVAPPAFADRVWRVAHSTAGNPGDYYVFLSDGSFLIASAHGTPSLGSWRGSGDSITVVEEGRPYPTAVLRLTADTFAIRLTSPGAPVDITFARAVPPAIEPSSR